ncbi:MAG: adenosylcobinamide-GDP ribazoletransferase [Ascidiaceihabitans sp.]|jgi:adenosylcobinamide-GDP ribazoletransferase
MDKNDPMRPSVWDLSVAGALLTRLPLPHAPQSAFENQARAVWAFPLVGLLIGVIMCLVGAIALALGLETGIAAGLMLGASMIATGAMHEDGLADCADGFWGGYVPARRLEIMKDSQIGTYGVLALVIAVGLRWMALTTLINFGWGAVIAAAVLSRAMMPVLMTTLSYARENGLAQSVGKPSMRMVQIGVVLGAVLAMFAVGWSALLVFIIALGCAVLVRIIAKAKIGGQTGDVLGATQVISETAVLITLTVI